MSSKKVMLIADDKRVNRFTLRTIFEDDFEIVECVNGKETIEYLQQENQKPAIILLDIIMPECDGYGVMDYMQEQELSEIPVVFITANDDESHVKKGFTMNIADFIHKPFDEEVVRHRVLHVLDIYG